MFVNVYGRTDGRTHRRKDAGSTGILKAHLVSLRLSWAKKSPIITVQWSFSHAYILTVMVMLHVTLCCVRPVVLHLLHYDAFGLYRLCQACYICPASVVVRPSSSVHNFKRLLLWNRLANQSQILCGASLGRGTKVYINGLGHMTKMAAMPIYGKNLKKSSSPEPEVLWSWNMAFSIGDSSSTKVI